MDRPPAPHHLVALLERSTSKTTSGPDIDVPVDTVKPGERQRTMITEQTLATIVNADPNAARVLEQHHLDYCCGGGRTLQQACDDAGVDIATVMSDLAAEPSGRSAHWAAMSPGELVDWIEATHHRYLHEELPRLDALAQKVASVHGARHPELTAVEAAYDALRSDLEPHLQKEEVVLFPRIRRLGAEQTAATAIPSLACSTLSAPISVMLSEHDRAGSLMADLRGLTSDYDLPDDACASYTALYRGLEQLEADTHLHVHIENNVLFPAVLALESEQTSPR